VSNLPENLYQRLQVRSDATSEVIEAAYKALLRANHPDHADNENDRVLREEASKALGEAHAVLSDSTRRRRYDDELAQETAALSALRAASDKATTNTKQVQFFNDGTQKGANSAQHEVPALVYDELSLLQKVQLFRMARHDTNWKINRKRMLASRKRYRRVPVYWLGIRDSSSLADVKVSLGEVILGSVAAAVASYGVLLWYSKQPVGFFSDTWYTAILFPVLSLSMEIEALICSIALILGGAFTALYWPAIRGSKGGRGRFLMRAILGLTLILTAPLVTIILVILAITYTIISNQRR